MSRDAKNPLMRVQNTITVNNDSDGQKLENSIWILQKENI